MAKKISFIFAVVLFVAVAGFNFAFAEEMMKRPDRIEIKICSPNRQRAG